MTVSAENPAEPLIAVGLAERDIGLLNAPETRALRNLILVIDTPDLNRAMRKIGRDARVVQILQMDNPDLPRSPSTRAFQRLCKSRQVGRAEIWLDQTAAPLKFDDKTARPDLSLAYRPYRWLRMMGFTEIMARARNWRQVLPDFKLLDAFKDTRASKRCFIMGNGPSLNEIDLSKLKNEVTFGSNRAYLGYPKWGFENTFWGCEDKLQIEAHHDEYEAALSPQLPKFVPFTYCGYFDAPNTVFFPLLYGNGRVFPNGLQFPCFSAHPRQLYHGFSISYSLIQIAALMGYEEVILVGMDHNYDLQPIAANNDNGKDTWSAQNATNPTHFDAAYTQGAKQFVKPRPVQAELAYMVARQWGLASDVQIVNATPGSKLDVFDRVEFGDLF